MEGCTVRVNMWVVMQVVTQRLMRLNQQGSPSLTAARVEIKRRKHSPTGPVWECLVARGHMDEVQALSHGVLHNDCPN